MNFNDDIHENLRVKFETEDKKFTNTYIVNSSNNKKVSNCKELPEEFIENGEVLCISKVSQILS